MGLIKKRPETTEDYNLNTQRRSITFIDLENWLAYYKIRHTIITNNTSRDIIVMVRLNSFGTMCINCDARVRKPEQVTVESALICRNNIYEMESRYEDRPNYTIYRYDMAQGYTQTASSFFACAVVSALTI